MCVVNRANGQCGCTKAGLRSVAGQEVLSFEIRVANQRNFQRQDLAPTFNLVHLPNSSSMAMITSTWSKLSSPRSFIKCESTVN